MKLRAACIFFVFLIGFPGNLMAADQLPLCMKPDPEKTAATLCREKDILPQDLLARLVYAEASSTAFGDDPLVYQAIAWGVMNRVRLAGASKSMRRSFGQGLAGVIFQKGQFNPAISRKSTFHRCFLCPEDAGRWQMACTAADIALVGKCNPFLQTPWEKRHGLSLVVNFYYPRSVQARQPLPPWEGRRDLTFIGDIPMGADLLSSQRIRFYRLTRPPADIQD